VTAKEMACIGIALDELKKAGMYEAMQKIIDVMKSGVLDHKVVEAEKKEGGAE